MSEVHVHAYCMPSRAAREHEVLMKVEASSAEHGAVASASPRDGSWQEMLHVLIARRVAQSDLTVRSWLATRLQLERRGFRRPFLHGGTARGYVHAAERRPWTDGTAFGPEACRRSGSDAFRYISSDPMFLGLRLLPYVYGTTRA